MEVNGSGDELELIQNHSDQQTGQQTDNGVCVQRLGEWVILNGTSTQLGYTVPSTLIHAGKYGTKDKLKMIENTQTKHNPEKAKCFQRKTQQNRNLLWHSATKRGGLIAQRSQAHTGHMMFGQTRAQGSEEVVWLDL